MEGIDSEAQVPGLLGYIAAAIGTQAAALRLLISIVIGFPLALYYRRHLYGKDPLSQHYFFAVSGFFIGYWNYELSILHSAIALLITYLIFDFFRGSSTAVVLTIVLNMGYLLCGYYVTATENYDIKWTMPQCVLTLRLIGLAFDIADGQQPEDTLSVKQKATALKQLPSLLEVAAFVYFPGSFLIGPQFNMKRYLDFVNGKLVERKVDRNGEVLPPDSLKAGIKRTLTGLLYVCMYQILHHYVSDQYLMAPEFNNLGFLKRCFLLGLWGRCNLYKYISCWLITEGVCTAFGITYNGKDQKGKDQWNGCANVKLLTFENATEFNHYIMSFNINTNQWCLEYVYKRVKFLGSKLYSQIITLTFLAVWHGLHSGYYLCFFQEFIIMYLEKDLKPVLVKNTTLQSLVKENFLFRLLVWSILKFYTFVFMGYSLIPFVLLSPSRYMVVYKSFYFMGHIIFLSYPLVAPYIKKALRPQQQPQTHQHTD